MNLLYSALVEAVVWLVLVPASLLGILAGRATWEELSQRLGRHRSVSPGEAPRVILHAVSVGEMAAAEALLPALAEELPGARFVLTTGNPDGMAAARAMARGREDVAAALLLPWDRARPLRRWLGHLRPDLFVVMETEIWPNLYRTCSRLGIPLCIANGRIYPADVERYRLARSFFRRVLANVVWVGVQSDADRERYLAIGGPGGRIEVVGNLKYDAPGFSDSPCGMPPSMVIDGSPPAQAATGEGARPSPVSSRDSPAIGDGDTSAPEAAQAGLERVDMILLAASTHPPEEELILDAFRRLRDEMPGLRCVIAPRRVTRAGSIRSIARSGGIEAALWSELRPGEAGHPVVVVDEMGILRHLFPRADLVIMGGSFAPRGGHNLLEPAAAGRPVIIGPHVEHFRAIVDDFLERDAVRVVEDAAGLQGILLQLLRDEAARAALGERARKAWEAGRGRAPVYARKLASIMRDSSTIPPG